MNSCKISNCINAGVRCVTIHTDTCVCIQYAQLHDTVLAEGDKWTNETSCVQCVCAGGQPVCAAIGCQVGPGARHIFTIPHYSHCRAHIHCCRPANAVLCAATSARTWGRHTNTDSRFGQSHVCSESGAHWLCMHPCTDVCAIKAASRARTLRKRPVLDLIVIAISSSRRQVSCALRHTQCARADACCPICIGDDHCARMQCHVNATCMNRAHEVREDFHLCTRADRVHSGHLRMCAWVFWQWS
jgi:hypothetical protein